MNTAVQALRRTLHERGFRMTPQRQLVLDAVAELEHATPEQICASVQRQAPAVNISTIYRTLDLLEQLGVVRHTHLGHGAPNYSVLEHKHVHLVCHWCGKVEEIPTQLLDPLAKQLRAEHGFTLDATHVALSGACSSCADAVPAAGGVSGAEGVSGPDAAVGAAEPSQQPAHDAGDHR